MKNSLTLAFAASFLCAGLLAGEGGAAFTLESPSFKAGGPIPAKFAMRKVDGGENASPALSWKNAPAGTKSFAILCVDVHPMARGWIHWMALGIPASCQALKEGESCSSMPEGAKELENSFGFRGWGGPQPPQGSGAHKYVFTIYALGEMKSQFKQGAMSEKDFLKAISGAVLGKASINGSFERK